MQSTNDSSELVIVMPAYNEADCIRPVVEKWLGVFNTLKIHGGKLLVVNDGSKDNTGAILDEISANNPSLKVIHQSNAGHGAALMRAYREGLSFKPKWIFHVDSDDQFVPADLSKLWEKRERSKFILGYREVRHDALHRLVITRILVALNLLVFGVYLKDSNVPYRLIAADYLLKLLSVMPQGVFAPNVFLSVLAAWDGQELMHIPITHQDRQTGQVSIVKWNLIKACLRSVKELIDFRLSLGRRIKELRS